METINYNTLKGHLGPGTNLFDIRSPEAFEAGFIQSALFIQPGDKATVKALDALAYYPLNNSIVITEANGLSSEVLSILRKVLGSEFSLLPNFSLETAREHGLETDMVIGLNAEEFALDVKHDRQIEVFDMRAKPDFETAHIKNSENISFNNLANLVLEYDKDDKVYLIGTSSSNALTAASLLRANGFNFCRPLLDEFQNLQSFGLTIKGKASRSTSKA